MVRFQERSWGIRQDMHPEHGGLQPGDPTYRSRGDCSGHYGLRMVDRDEDEKGNGRRSDEAGGRERFLTAGFY